MPGNREKGKYWKSRKGKGFKGTPSWKISNQQQRNFIHEMEQVQSDAQSERGSEDLTLGQAKNTSSSVCETPMPTNSISNSNDLASASKRKLDSHQAEESQTRKTSRRKVTRMEGDLDQAEQSQQDKQQSDNDHESADDLSDLSGYRLTDLECLGNALKNAHRCKKGK